MARQTPKRNLQQKTKYVLWMSTATLIVSLLGSVGIANGQVLWNPVKTTCNLRFGRGTVVGHKMFVDGGEQIDQQYYKNGTDKPFPNSNMTRWQNKHLWELDLSAKFNTSKPPWTANAKPDDWNRHYNGAKGALWDFGDGKFYTWGGWMSNVYEGPPGGHRIGSPYYTQVQVANGLAIYKYQLPPPAIQMYDTGVANWTSIALPSSIHRLSDVGYTQSKRNKIGYMLGGIPVVEKSEGGTDAKFSAPIINAAVWQNTLSAYDPRNNTFSTSVLPDDIGATNSVVLHSLDRVGDEGVLIAFSGVSKNNNNENYRPMDEIWIYDIASSHWMKQAATGDIPSVRTGSCSVLVPAPDLSSYQLYMFSGSIIFGQWIRILDMYVLSMPAFVWKKIDLVNYPSEWGIADMACDLYEDRQFIIVPGEVNVSTSATVNDTFFQKCNIGTAVQVFDTYDWTFKAEFDPDNKGSKVPPAIVDLIGGDEKGNAKLQQPGAGWDDQELGRVFQIRNKLPTNITHKTTSTSTDSPPYQTMGDTNESKSNRGAIAGGVVGGFVFLGGFVLLGLLIWWRKCQGAEQTALPELGDRLPQELQSYQPPQELQAYEPPEMGETKSIHPQSLPKSRDIPTAWV